MKFCAGMAAGLVAAVLAAPAAALGVGTLNTFDVGEFVDDGTLELVEFSFDAEGAVDVTSGFPTSTLGSAHSFQGLFEVTDTTEILFIGADGLVVTGAPISGSFLILDAPAEPQSVGPVILSGNLVGGELSYTKEITFNGFDTDERIIDVTGDLLFDKVASDVIDVADLLNADGLLEAEVGDFLGVASFAVPLSTLVQQLGANGFVDYGDPFAEPSSDIPVPAALPLLATGLGLIGWMRARRKPA
ncbi:MAG: VPLPA-CTERM sorting domain-containing protein [Pseudomonadota bacterium]